MVTASAANLIGLTTQGSPPKNNAIQNQGSELLHDGRGLVMQPQPVNALDGEERELVLPAAQLCVVGMMLADV